MRSYLALSMPFRAISTATRPRLTSIIRQPAFKLMVTPTAHYSFLKSAFYSTSSTPPPKEPFNHPAPPPHDKDAKGKVILNRATRAFTFSASTLMVIGASGVSILVLYLILSELFLPSGDTKTFNKAVKLIETNEEAQHLLRFEPGTRLKAHGEVSPDVWVRNRPPQSVKSRGKDGKARLFMKFVVETDNGDIGTVSLEQVDESFWKADFAYIALDVPGQKRLYIVEPKFQHKNYVPRVGGKEGFLGLKWGPKKGGDKE